jgi:hypothetical protein
MKCGRKVRMLTITQVLTNMNVIVQELRTIRNKLKRVQAGKIQLSPRIDRPTWLTQN